MSARKIISIENKMLVQHPDYKMEIVQILRSNLTPKLMRERILDYHENDIAAAIGLLNKDERKRIYPEFPKVF